MLRRAGASKQWKGAKYVCIGERGRKQRMADGHDPREQGMAFACVDGSAGQRLGATCIQLPPWLSCALQLGCNNGGLQPGCWMVRAAAQFWSIGREPLCLFFMLLCVINISGGARDNVWQWCDHVWQWCSCAFNGVAIGLCRTMQGHVDTPAVLCSAFGTMSMSNLCSSELGVAAPPRFCRGGYGLCRTRCSAVVI